ncbi:hypothetical protein C8R42DRAFT_112374 [Lentinula raphanica]|nr:hypothetical protein C8R42DRAFT_112374 [Lentinula raphanica]
MSSQLYRTCPRIRSSLAIHQGPRSSNTIPRSTPYGALARVLFSMRTHPTPLILFSLYIEVSPTTNTNPFKPNIHTPSPLFLSKTVTIPTTSSEIFHDPSLRMTTIESHMRQAKQFAHPNCFNWLRRRRLNVTYPYTFANRS